MVRQNIKKQITKILKRWIETNFEQSCEAQTADLTDQGKVTTTAILF